MKLISQFELLARRQDAHQSIFVKPGTITIFVGPNNSGKSKALREIKTLACGDTPRGEPRLIGDVSTIETPSIHDFLTHIRSFTADENGIYRVSTSLDDTHARVTFNERDAQEKMKHLKHNFMPYSTLSLNPRARYDILKPAPLTNFHDPPSHILDVIYRNNTLRSEIRELLLNAFGKHFIIDHTNPSALQASFTTCPIPPQFEKSYDDEAIRFQRDHARPVNRDSDGVISYTSIICSLIAAQKDIIFVDEPEAFLHPPLAQRLGYEVGRLASKKQLQVFIATHSIDFIVGTIEAINDIGIVRLSFDGRDAEVVFIEPQELKELLQDPIVRNSRILDTIFFPGAVVAEHDTDRVFYEEIYRRLRSLDETRPIIAFNNGHSKAELHRITRALRKCGVPTAAIVDIDVFKKDGNELRKLMEAACVPGQLASSWLSIRAKYEQYCVSHQLEMRDGGLSILLEASLCETMTHLLSGLKDYGIFVVPVGELERWLGYLSPEIQGKKTEWVRNAIERMSQNDQMSDYAPLDKNDVWSFVEAVGAWVGDNSRRGMPS